MSLITTLAGKHLLSVNLQPDESYFCEAMEPEAMDRLDEVLKGFQPGDIEKLEAIIELINFSLPSELLGAEEGDAVLEFAPDEYLELVKAKDLLYGFRDMCRLMEES